MWTFAGKRNAYFTRYKGILSVAAHPEFHLNSCSWTSARLANTEVRGCSALCEGSRSDPFVGETVLLHRVFNQTQALWRRGTQRRITPFLVRIEFWRATRLLRICTHSIRGQPVAVTPATEKSRLMNQRIGRNRPTSVEIHSSLFLTCPPVIAFSQNKLGKIPRSRQRFMQHSVRIWQGILAAWRLAQNLRLLGGIDE